MRDLPIGFWTGGLAALIGGVGLYLKMRNGRALKRISREVASLKRIYLRPAGPGARLRLRLRMRQPPQPIVGAVCCGNWCADASWARKRRFHSFS